MADIETLAESIKARGVTHVFGIPGSGPSLTLLDSLEKKGIPFYLNHFEGAGVLMAGAMGRLSGKAGVAVGIKGPGLANMLPGIAACRLENFPVVSLSEAYPPDTPSHTSHKRLDHQALIAGGAKGRRFFSLKGPNFTDLAVWAEEEVPGPVHMDFSASPIPSDMPIPGNKHGKISSGPDSQKIFDIVSNSHRPIIIAGTCAIRKKMAPALNSLAVPSFSVAAAKGIIDETLPHAAGIFTGVGGEFTPEFSIIPMADLIIGIGLRHNEVLNVKPFGCKSINLDPLGDELGYGFEFDHVFSLEAGDVESLLAGLRCKSWGLTELSDQIRNIRRHMLRDSFMPANVFRRVEKYFDHQLRIVLDTGHFCTIGEHVFRIRKPEHYLSAGQGRYMGIGLPLSIGASLYDPDIPTVLFSGDGGIGMFISEVKLAAQFEVPLIIILMSDGYLGSIRASSISNRMTERPVTILQPSWYRVFQAMDIHSMIAKSENDLEEILNSWRMERGPLFIETRFDPEAYQHMVDGIRP
ncbi:MAG: thiamine pyrophosphate-binding protein [Deltaproteobacteria bacterium]|nr:thiamine pyrophosphate-binding protein [Deltaproteobacteria bacterium]